MEVILNKYGFEIVDYLCDSTHEQFWASEQYEKDIPLAAENSYAINPEKSIFNKKQIEEWTIKALELNREKRGDRIIAFIKAK